MSDGMNIDGFKLSGDGISLSDFTAKVNKDNELINIYKAFDKNGDNKLSRDELAGLLGAYKMIDSNGDGTLSNVEAADFNNKISKDIARDSNTDNDNLVINFNKFNDFFSSLKTLIDPNSTESGDVYYYDKDGKITGGTDSAGEFTREYTDNGYTDTYMDRTRYYDKDGKYIGGIDTDGDTWTQTYNDDGSYTVKYDEMEEYYNPDGKQIGGKFFNNGTEYTVKYDEQGNETYTEYTKSDGTKYFTYNDNNAVPRRASTDVDAEGNITTSAIEGESFQATMKRLGITEDDIDAFKKANPRAASKGWFLAGEQDVKIPASIAKKLDYAKMMVNADEQAEAYRRRISGS